MRNNAPSPHENFQTSLYGPFPQHSPTTKEEEGAGTNLTFSNYTSFESLSLKTQTDTRAAFHQKFNS